LGRAYVVSSIRVCTGFCTRQLLVYRPSCHLQWVSEGFRLWRLAAQLAAQQVLQLASVAKSLWHNSWRSVKGRAPMGLPMQLRRRVQMLTTLLGLRPQVSDWLLMPLPSYSVPSAAAHLQSPVCRMRRTAPPGPLGSSNSSMMAPGLQCNRHNVHTTLTQHVLLSQASMSASKHRKGASPSSHHKATLHSLAASAAICGAMPLPTTPQPCLTSGLHRVL
jgi:hypothetical protein